MSHQHHAIYGSSQAIDTNLLRKYQLNQSYAQKSKMLTCTLSSIYFSTQCKKNHYPKHVMTMIVNFATIGCRRQVLGYGFNIRLLTNLPNIMHHTS
jgi:hypothetical protein